MSALGGFCLGHVHKSTGGIFGAIPEPVDPVDVACAPAMMSILGHCAGKRTEGMQTTVVGSAGVRACFGRHWRTVDCGQWKLTNADAAAAAQASSQPPRRHPVKGGVSRRAQRANP